MKVRLFLFFVMLLFLPFSLFASWWGIYTPLYDTLESDFEVDKDLFLAVQKNTIPDEYYSGRESYSWKYRYEFDDKNRVISIWSNEVGEKDYSLIRYTYTTDKITRITRDFYSSFDDSVPKTSYAMEIRYDNNSITEHKTKNGELDEDVVYTLDDKGRIVRAVMTSISAFSGELQTDFDRTYSYPSDDEYCDLLERLNGLGYLDAQSEYRIEYNSLLFMRSDGSVFRQIDFDEDRVIRIYEENDSPSAENKYHIVTYEYDSRNNLIRLKDKHSNSKQGGGSLWDAETVLYYEDNITIQNPVYFNGNAVVNDQTVRIREKPDLQSKTIGHVNTNEQVTILDQTNFQMAIREMNSVWYKIRTAQGVEGWSYGYFIDLERVYEN